MRTKKPGKSNDTIGRANTSVEIAGPSWGDGPGDGKECGKGLRMGGRADYDWATRGGSAVPSTSEAQLPVSSFSPKGCGMPLDQELGQ